MTALALHYDETKPLVDAWLIGFSSPNTRRAYKGDIERWLNFCQLSGIHPLHARREHVDAWARIQPGAPATLARRITAVASWYTWLVDERHLDHNPTARVRRPRIDPDDSRMVGLTREQAVALVKRADADGPRTKALVRLLLANALRVGELIALDVEDLGTARGHCTLRVKGKGGRIQVVPLAPATAEAIDDYLRTREDVEKLPALAAGARGRRPLFLSRAGGRLGNVVIWRQLRRLAVQAGPELADVAGRISPHWLRHTAITLALDGGASLRDVQDYARHANANTTRGYDQARFRFDRSPTFALSDLF